MATSSKFILLSSSVLLEYVYADRAVVNDPGNPFRVPTTSASIWKTRNDFTGEPQILNSDSAWQIQDGLPVGTGNVRNRSFAYVSPHRGGLLDIDKVTFFNDYSSGLTDTANLAIPFLNPKAPVYDTIKLHLVQGFNFEDHEGLTLTVKCRDKDGGNIVLCNLVYLKDDLWETMNPSSFFFAGRVYDSYLEVRVLSLYDLINEYWLGTLDGDTVSERITNGVGLQRAQSLQVAFSWVRRREKIDDQDYIDIYETKEVDLPTRDQFETIAAYVAESTDGDYFEFYATHNGAIIEPFITDLNRSGGDYVLLHDITLSEYVNNPSDGTYNWVKTHDFQQIQTDSFDLPNRYRPVVINPGAVAIRIDYVARLFNRNDSSQVWKSGSVVSNSANKYGRLLRKINLGVNPVQARVYNRRVTKDFTVARVSEPVFENTKYVTSFIGSAQVSVSFESVSEDSLSSPSASKLRVYPNGLARIFIPPTVSYTRFVLRSSTDRGESLLNLHGSGEMRMVFSSGRGDEIEVPEFPSSFASKGSGEVIFRLSETQAKSVLALEDRTFSLFMVNEKGEKTWVYSGRFYSIDEYRVLAETDRIAELEDAIKKQSELLETVSATVESQSATIADLLLKLSAAGSTGASGPTVDPTVRAAIDDVRSRQGQSSDAVRAASDSILGRIGGRTVERRPEPRPSVSESSRRADEMKTDVSSTKSSPYTDPTA